MEGKTYMSKYKTYKQIKQGFSSERKEKIEQGANKIRTEKLLHKESPPF